MGGIHLEPEIGYWHRSEEAFGIEVGTGDYQIGASIVQTLAQRGKMAVFLGEGAALHLVQHSARAAGDRAAESTPAPGLHAFSGLDRAFSPRLSLLATIRFDWVVRQGEGGPRFR